METLDLGAIEQPRTKWVAFGGVEFLLKYASPHENDQFRRRLRQDGIIRTGKNGEIDVAPGREQAFYRAMADQYVMDWRGNITDPDGNGYTAEKMAKVLEYHGGILVAIQEAVSEHESFFGNGATGQT